MAGAPLHADVRFWRDAALPGVEARSATYTQHAFRIHTHKDWIISLVEAGCTRFSLGPAAPQPLHTARAGQIVVIPAGAPHACNPEPGSGFSYRLVALAPGWLSSAAQAQGGAALHFPSPVLDDSELFAAWRNLHEAFVWGAPAAHKQALLLACLRELSARHAAPGLPNPADGNLAARNPAVALARAAIAARPGEFVPLDELARTAGLSRHHFVRVFKAATGLPPHAYQMQQAIEHAKALLAGGMAISQAALDAGFADQSHFSRRFREFTGATPRQYAENRPCENWQNASGS
jgi:AraC-like DNA-binding protein